MISSLTFIFYLPFTYSHFRNALSRFALLSFSSSLVFHESHSSIFLKMEIRKYFFKSPPTCWEIFSAKKLSSPIAMESRRKLNLGEQQRLNVSDRETKRREKCLEEILLEWKTEWNCERTQRCNEDGDSNFVPLWDAIVLALSRQRLSPRIIFQWWNWLRKSRQCFMSN